MGAAASVTTFASVYQAAKLYELDERQLAELEQSLALENAETCEPKVIPGPVTIEPTWDEVTFDDGSVLKRIKKVIAEVRTENMGHGTHTTTRTRRYAGKRGKKGDVAGYLIARIFGGRGDIEENIVPMDATIENRDFKDFKYEIRQYIKLRPDRRVVITALPRYRGKSGRPYEIKYKAEFFKGNRLDDKLRSTFQNE